MSVFKKAKWIWIKESKVDQYGEFFTKFNGCDSATLNISCDGDYTLYLNGKYIASNQYGDFEHYKIYDSVDITSYINEGENTLAVLVHHIGKDFSRYKNYKAGLIFEVLDGENVILSSGVDVLSRESRAYQSGRQKQISPQLGFSYLYDNTKEDSWILGYGDGFEKSCPKEKQCQFFPRPIPKLSLGNLINGTEVDSQNSTNFVYDLGKETVGLLSFELDASEISEINISYGEYLENGHVRRHAGWDDFSVDYVAKVGKNVFANYMLRFACRYIEIVSSNPISNIKIGLIPQYNIVKRREKDFDNELDKKIYDICVNTLELCMMEHYVDCPWREQCLYAFDSRNQMLCGYYAFDGGNYNYARSNLLLMSYDRRDDGLLSICYPCGIDLTIPSFSLYYIVSVLEYIKHSNDTDFVHIVNHKMVEILETYKKNADGGLVKIFSGESHWNFYDWSPNLSGNLWHSQEAKADATINLLTIIALKSYKEICKITGLEFGYDNMLSSLEKLTKETFFDKEKMVFVDTVDQRNELALTNALGVISGVADEYKDIVANKLKGGELTPCSLSMKTFVYDALVLADKDGNREYILNDIRQTYKKMLDFGSTTVWETAVGRDDFEGAGSLCHGWSSIPVYYYTIL